MPLYEFRCKRCGHVFEELVFRKDEIADLVCPSCEAPRVEQLLSTFSAGSASGPGSRSSSSSGCGSSGFS